MNTKNYDLLNHSLIELEMDREDLMAYKYNIYPAVRFVNK